MKSTADLDGAPRHLDDMAERPMAMKDVLDAIVKWRIEPWQAVWDGSWCKWHIHADSEKCAVTKFREMDS